MNYLITGASGLLGNAIKNEVLSHGHRCQTLNQDAAWKIAISETSSQLREHDILIHAGANTNVELCEQEPADCFKDNYYLTELLAQKCAAAGTKFVFTSSTGVYGKHKNRPYREYDEVVPTTVHHRSKRLAEIAVMNCSSKNLIIRTGWLFGGAKTNPKNFVNNRILEAINALQKNKLMFSNKEQYGAPTYVNDVAGQMLRMINHDVSGTYNVVNSGQASRYEYTSEILKIANVPKALTPVSADTFNRKANVSNNEMAINWKLDILRMNVMRDWKDGLADYIRSSGQIRDSI